MNLDRLRAIVEEVAESGELPGVGLSIRSPTDHSDLIAGVADTVGTPLDGDSPGRYYSSAKLVTSIVVLQLIEAGHLELDAAISTILPEWADVDPAPTVRQLLTHTAGLTYPANPAAPSAVDADGVHPVDAAYFAAGIDHEGVLSLAEFSRRLAAQPLCFAPGTQWRYSLSHDLLGRVIEVAAGESLDELARRQIFEPLGLTRTGFAAQGLPAELGSCWIHRPGRQPRFELADPAGAASAFMNPGRMLSGGGGLLSTLNDYTRLCEAVLVADERLMGVASFDQLLCDQLAADIAGPDENSGFGFGGLVGRPGGLLPEGVFSWGGYAGTQFLIDRNAGVVVCLHLQVQHDFTVTIWHEIVSHLYEGSLAA